MLGEGINLGVWRELIVSCSISRSLGYIFERLLRWVFWRLGTIIDIFTVYKLFFLHILRFNVAGIGINYPFTILRGFP
jgi:hypothetical protein